MPRINPDLLDESGAIPPALPIPSQTRISHPNTFFSAISDPQSTIPRLLAGFIVLVLGLAVGAGIPGARSLDLGVQNTGLSIGNSKSWTGLRINTVDYKVNRVTGVNLTLWKPKNNNTATVTGLSLGLVAPDAGWLRGIQLGVVGVGASQHISGISGGIMGVGSRGSLCGISFGGLGAGAGINLTGLAVGGLGAGAGQNVTGVLIAGLGTGAGQNLTGVSVGGLIAGAGANLQGVAVALLGAGAGANLTGVTIAGVGAGAGNQLTGFALGGIGAGAPILRGVVLGGLFAGGADIKGVTLTAGWTRVSEDGNLSGLAIGSFNQVRGSQTGLSLGIVNSTRQLRGVQIGLVNHVAENPAVLRTLPFINAHF